MDEQDMVTRLSHEEKKQIDQFTAGKLWERMTSGLMKKIEIMQQKVERTVHSFFLDIAS